MPETKKGVEPKTNKRHFQYIDPVSGLATGRYSGVKPKQAGNKVYSSVWRERKAAGKPLTGEFKFAIRECTRNSRRKVYYYIGKRVRLDKPTKVNIKDVDGETKVVEYNYSNKVMKDKEATKKAAIKAKKEEKENRKNKAKKGKRKRKQGTKTAKKKTTTTKKTTAKKTAKGKKKDTKKEAKKGKAAKPKGKAVKVAKKPAAKSTKGGKAAKPERAAKKTKAK